MRFLDFSPNSVLHRRTKFPVRLSSSAEREVRNAGFFGTLLFGVFALCLIWLGAWYVAREDFARTEAAAYQNTDNLARAFEEHIIRVLQAYDQTLLFVRSLYAKDPERFDLVQWAREQQFMTDVALQVGLIDGNGIFVGSNLAKASGRLDLGDREHFRVHANTGRDELFISKPVVGRISNKSSIQLSRRINAADGSFLGVVVVSIDPDYLSKFYESIDTKKNGAVFLAGLDGIVRARAANSNATTAGQSLVVSTLFGRLAEANSGTYLSKGQLDGISRLSSYRVVKGYPLVVVVGLAREDVFASYERNQFVYFSAAGFISLLVIIFTAMNLRHWMSLGHTRDKLKASELQYRSVVNGVREVIFQIDDMGSFTFLNNAWKDVTGFTIEDSLKRPVLNYVYPADRAVAAALFEQKAVQESDVPHRELRFVTASGDIRWVEIGARSTFDHSGLYTGMAGAMSDVTSRRAAEKKIWEAANIDALTGVPNRQRLHEIMDAIIADANEADVTLTLMLIDLDNFKIVNDTLGHEAGDIVLRTVATRIRRTVRAPNLIARLGGDEFAVLLRGPSDRSNIEAVTQRILRLLQRKINYRGQSIEICSSIGIASCPQHARTRNDLLRAADLALYQAKHAGRNRAVVFESRLLLEAENKFEVLTSMRAAIAQGRVVPVYQPEFSVESGEIVGFEALARVQSAGGQLIAAGQFLSAFQDPEVGRQLGLEMVDRVTRDLAAWLAADLDIKRVAVNVSNIELRLDDFSDRVMSMLRARGIGFHHFEIEVTETVALDEAVSPIGRNLRAFAAHGISLALDDFGTGFASLTHLKSLPIARVKIDQSFIRNIVTEPQSRSIVDAIVRLSHSLGKSVVAEGVEEDTQLDAIRELKCDIAQGFLLAKPLRAEEIAPFMLRHIAQLATNPVMRDRFQGQRRPRIHIVASGEAGGGTERSA